MSHQARGLVENLKMPKTVTQLIGERKNTGNIVYKESLSYLSLYSEQGKAFEMKTPVKAAWFMGAQRRSLLYQVEQLDVSLSILNIPESKMISSNYQFKFKIGNWKEISGELTSKEESFVLYSRDIPELSEDLLKFSLEFSIKYVGHPRMRNKNDISHNTVPLLKEMFENPVLADFKFIVKGEEFKVQKSVMAASSPFFLKMLAENKEGESKIDHIDSNVFEALLKFIYTVGVPENVDHRELYAAAHCYEIEKLKVICEQEVHTSLNINNAPEIFLWAYPYEELEDLKYDAWDYVKLQILDKLDIKKVETADFEDMKEIVESVMVTKQKLADLENKQLKETS